MHAEKPVDKAAQDNMNKAIGRFNKEDPTFHVRVDEESSETIISGMGELHLDVYVERMLKLIGRTGSYKGNQAVQVSEWIPLKKD